jgi:hypothetical protein
MERTVLGTLPCTVNGPYRDLLHSIPCPTGLDHHLAFEQKSALLERQRAQELRRVDAEAGLRVLDRTAAEPVDPEARHLNCLEAIARYSCGGRKTPANNETVWPTAGGRKQLWNIARVVLAIPIQGDYSLSATAQRLLKALLQGGTFAALLREGQYRRTSGRSDNTTPIVRGIIHHDDWQIATRRYHNRANGSGFVMHRNDGHKAGCHPLTLWHASGRK